MRKILRPLRNSKLDLCSYLKIRELRITSNTDESDVPHLRGPWRAAVDRFNLDDELKISDWPPIIDTFITKGWDTPHKLSLVKSSTFQVALADLPRREAAIQLWTATFLLFADLSSESYLLLKGDPSDAEKLFAKLRTSPARLKAAISDTRRATKRLKLKKDFSALCPSPKLSHIRKAHLPQFKMVGSFA